MSNLHWSPWELLLCRARDLDQGWRSFNCMLIKLAWTLQLRAHFCLSQQWQLGEPPEKFYKWNKICLMAHHFYRQGEIVLIFLLYLQAKLAGAFQRWSIFLLCFSLCLFLRQLTSPKWICAIHHSLTELGEQFHYSLALFLCSTTKMSEVFFFFLNLLSPLNKMGAGN